MIKPRNIYLLVLPRVHLLDLAAPAQIFAHEVFEGQVAVRYIAPEPEVHSHQGLHLSQLAPLPEYIDADDWVLIIGSGHLYKYLDEPVSKLITAWLAQAATQCGLIAGICSGTLLAAQAGILDGKRCTTHHHLIPYLKDIAPKATVQEDCIFVSDGPIWTSAGITTSMDLCLHLVSEYWGHEIATTLARDLVLYQRRSGHEAQLSFWLQHRNHMQSRVHRLQDLVMESPGHPWTVTELAEKVHLSERQLRRIFQNATGHSLQDYLQLAKLELAQRLLEQTTLSLEDIAERCGFSAERSLRRTWSRWRPQTPAEYRRSEGIAREH
jgi:transcriptional regulator GlxA family with amidase domain